MTPNQRLVYRWLRNNSSASGIIKVASSEIAVEFEFSYSNTKKILKGLVDKGYLELISPGVGRRPAKYRLPSRSDNQFPSRSGSSRSTPGTNQQTRRGSHLKTVFTSSKNNREAISKGKGSNNAHSNTHIYDSEPMYERAQRLQRLFQTETARTRKPVKTTNSPF